MENVTGRQMAPERLAVAAEKYRLIGGGSPLLKTSERQAGKLETLLRAGGADVRVRIGMRYWHPLIAETVRAVLRDHPEKIVLMCLTPYFSRLSAGEYLRSAERSLADAGSNIPVSRIDSWHDEPALIAGLSAAVKQGLAVAGAPDLPVVFTAHSIPQETTDDGSPYAGQVAETARLTAAAAGVRDWRLAWQSEGHGQKEWLKPTAEDALREIKEKGGTAVLVAPIGFISDHMETLYDLDIVLKDKAVEQRLAFHRAPCLNDNEKLVEAMASAVQKTIVGGS